MPTIVDVANLSGVSTQTVSRVLNDHPYVSEKTRKKVQAAIKKLDYRPNIAARALSNGQTNSLGFVGWNTTLYGPASTIHSVQSAARNRGYFTSTYSLKDMTIKDLEEALDEMRHIGADALLLNIPVDIDLGKIADRLTEIPTILLENENDLSIPTVNVDQVSGARAVMDELIRLGHEEIAHISGPQNWFDARHRLEGWQRSIKEYSLPTSKWIEGDWSARSGYEAMAQLLKLKRRPTAVFVANDAMALGALKLLNERGIKVPEELSIIGFDDIPEANFLVPGLSTIRQDFQELGRVAIELLIDSIKNGTQPPEATLIEPELVLRESVAPR